MEKLMTIVRIVGLSLTLAGWGLSLHFMYLMGKEQQSIPIILFFFGWVSLPFVTLLAMEWRHSSWKPPVRLFLYALMEGIAILSAIIYSGVFAFEGRPPAFIYLLIPVVSLTIIGVVYGVLRRMNSVS